jgi:prepilin-type N-terminal cleavage/methylation domain-containing protein
MTVLSRRQQGFTLLESLIVVAIIGIAAAVALPQVLTFMRTYRVRAAANEVGNEVSASRLKAISKNANQGVVFVILPANSANCPRPTACYGWVIEDDQDPTNGFRTTRVDPWTGLLVDANQLGTLRSLPNGIEFDPTGVNDAGFRFSRLGGWCDPTGTATTEPCPSLGLPNNFVVNGATGSTIRVRRTDGGATATITVGTGGRVRIQ